MSSTIRVGMADWNICSTPDSITTLGLGSCVGIIIYDNRSKICGLAHIMLPDSTLIRRNDNRAKFADTGIDDMLDKLIANGARRNNLVAKIAGGAQMFALNTNSEMLRIGEKNVIATKSKLATLGIPILAEDTGLSYGRTIEFFPETGDLFIKVVGKESKVI